MPGLYELLCVYLGVGWGNRKEKEEEKDEEEEKMGRRGKHHYDPDTGALLSPSTQVAGIAHLCEFNASLFYIVSSRPISLKKRKRNPTRRFLLEREHSKGNRKGFCCTVLCIRKIKKKKNPKSIEEWLKLG